MKEQTMPELSDRTPDPRLGAIVGRWHTSGHVIGDPNVTVAGTDTYEILPGGHFLIHHVDVTVGDHPLRAIEIIGEPDGQGGYLARSFDSRGSTGLMQLSIDADGAFHFTGGGDIASAAQSTDTPPAQVRSTLSIAEDHSSMTAFWERSDDGSTWHPWMGINFTRRPIA